MKILPNCISDQISLKSCFYVDLTKLLFSCRSHQTAFSGQISPEWCFYVDLTKLLFLCGSHQTAVSMWISPNCCFYVDLTKLFHYRFHQTTFLWRDASDMVFVGAQSLWFISYLNVSYIAASCEIIIGWGHKILVLSGARGRIFGLCLHILTYFMHVRSESSVGN